MLEVRPVQPSEHDAVGELLGGTYLAEGWAGPDYAEHLRRTAHRAEHATVLVALLDGRLVGTVTVVLAGGEYAEAADPGEAVVRMLVVDPAARGAGAGRALVARCLELAREAGCPVVRLSTQDEMHAARRVYESFGFVRTPERDWSPVEGLLLRTYALPLRYCGHCGEPGVEHDEPLEPPRYCPRCRRRMVVQVHPTGWSARCVEHGTTTSP